VTDVVKNGAKLHLFRHELREFHYFFYYFALIRAIRGKIFVILRSKHDEDRRIREGLRQVAAGVGFGSRDRKFPGS
jgi:hypothetical protein